MTSPTSMTQSAALKVPSAEQCRQAQMPLYRAWKEATYLGPEINNSYHQALVVQEFENAASALGLRLSADEPAAQQPSDLVKRLREMTPIPTALEAADRIEALVKAARAFLYAEIDSPEHGDTARQLSVVLARYDTPAKPDADADKIAEEDRAEEIAANEQFGVGA